jgi:hypothetical protein
VYALTQAPRLAARLPQLAGAFIPGSTPQDDATRLDQAQRSKLSSDSQKAYITAFYRNRMSLSEQNPDAADSWISSQVSRLAHQQTGLTAQGTSVAGASVLLCLCKRETVASSGGFAPPLPRRPADRTQSHPPRNWQSLTGCQPKHCKYC